MLSLVAIIILIILIILWTLAVSVQRFDEGLKKRADGKDTATNQHDAVESGRENASGSRNGADK
ncbi:hypothetical protein HYN48_13010 [Flavobacterium magnum]|uniref:Uncharacterized protein n=1 Tax=Flavobacterium magnum TaxID=2162713 RepID=A0A2S0RI33_9FLAO|nr:hypothetical protein HYN48_13010 [Flavobacterium magnum]